MLFLFDLNEKKVFKKKNYTNFCYCVTVLDLWKVFQIIKQFQSSIKIIAFTAHNKRMKKNKSNQFPDNNKMA